VSQAGRWGQIGFGVLSSAAARAPHQAGVYLFLDRDNSVLYVGKAGDVCRRLRQHAKIRPPESALHQRYDLVRKVVWEVAADEEAAVRREADLIFALRPPFNANTGLREADPVRPAFPVRYVALRDLEVNVIRLDLVPEPSHRVYGCFPHLGKGVASRLGILCSDGYTALLRLLWASGGEGTHIPSAVSKSAPQSFTVATTSSVRRELHLFLSGFRPRLAEELLRSASRRPEYMLPALRRDSDLAVAFFISGPQLVRARKARHGVRTRILDGAAYRRLVKAEIDQVINGSCTAHVETASA
jgi:predicted GIY-YIG superfamily endonuclease